MQLVVGRVGRPHGVRGEVSIDVRTDVPDLRFAPGVRLDTEPAGHGPLEVAAVRDVNRRLLVRFAGVEDRGGAEALRGLLLCVDSGSSPSPADADEFWDHELVGLRVRTVEGSEVGVVTDVLHPSGGDLLAVARDVGELLVPFVAAIVPAVDVAAGRLVIDPPPGLLDL